MSCLITSILCLHVFKANYALPPTYKGERGGGSVLINSSNRICGMFHSTRGGM